MYCHHIDEINHENLSNKNYIKEFRYPFDLQKKDRLVYCDLFEHAILHVLIAEETNLMFGISGYQVYILPMIKEWYINRKPPKPKWMQKCYNKAYMKSEETSKLLSNMESVISKERERLRKERERLRKEKEKIKKEENMKILKIVEDHGYMNLGSNNSRFEIVQAMYILKENGAYGYNNQYEEFVYSEKLKEEVVKPVEFDVFEKRMMLYDLDGVLKNIELFIALKERKISKNKYILESDKNSMTIDQAEDKRIADKKRKEFEKKKAKKEKKKEKDFYTNYPAFKKVGVKYNLTRQEVNILLFKYYNEFSCFLKFQGAMKEYNRDELLEKLYSFVK